MLFLAVMRSGKSGLSKRPAGLVGIAQAASRRSAGGAAPARPEVFMTRRRGGRGAVAGLAFGFDFVAQEAAQDFA